jgi:SPP1 gp7 family putative phage head morphogenesis protein
MTCQDYRITERKKKKKDYWKTPEGIEQRIKLLASNTVYRIYNNAVKVIAGDILKAKWLIWVTKGDDRVCPICAPLHGRKYKPYWFMPQMPVHPNCRCMWTVEYE